MAAKMDSGLEVAPSPAPQHDGTDGEKQAYFDSANGRWDFKQPAVLRTRHPHETSEDNSQRRWPERHPLLLAAIAALFTAVVVGAAVGGGVASTVGSSKEFCTSHSNASQAASTTSSTAASPSASGLLSNYTIASPRDIATVAIDCPAIDKQTYTTSSGPTFAIACTVGVFGGDVGCMRAYTLYDCIEACAAINYLQGVSKACTQIEFHSDMANETGPPAYGNCWLKNGTAVPDADEAGDLEHRNLAASAQIVSV